MIEFRDPVIEDRAWVEELETVPVLYPFVSAAVFLGGQAISYALTGQAGLSRGDPDQTGSLELSSVHACEFHPGVCGVLW